MTLRLRLTILYTALLGVTLVVFSAILYVVLQNTLVQELDRALISGANGVQQRLVTERTLAGIPLLVFDPSPIREFATPGIYVQILDPMGRIAARSANLSSESLPINPDLVQATLAGETSLTNTSPGRSTEPLRVLTKPVFVANNVVWVLQVGASLYNVRLTMRLMLLLLTAGVVTTLTVAAAAIWFLAGRALKPLERIASTAEYIGSSQDLSQRLKVQGPNDEVGRLGRAFNTMMGRLEDSFVAQRQFIADSSHELRTPLTVIRGNLDLLKRDSRPKSRAESLAAMDAESLRMAKIVDDLMLLVQLDGAQETHLRPVALEEVTLQVYHQTRVLAADNSVKLGRIDAVIVSAEHDRLVQLLLNLVDNAIKYTPVGGAITIECQAPEHSGHPGFAMLAVSDNGIGISAEDLPHIFDRFYRSDKARSREQGGTGLGLAIVKSIAEAYGGRVLVESELGKGSTFRVLLPAS